MSEPRSSHFQSFRIISRSQDTTAHVVNFARYATQSAGTCTSFPIDVSTWLTSYSSPVSRNLGPLGRLCPDRRNLTRTVRYRGNVDIYSGDCNSSTHGEARDYDISWSWKRLCRGRFDRFKQAPSCARASWDNVISAWTSRMSFPSVSAGYFGYSPDSGNDKSAAAAAYSPNWVRVCEPKYISST